MLNLECTIQLKDTINYLKKFRVDNMQKKIFYHRSCANPTKIYVSVPFLYSCANAFCRSKISLKSTNFQNGGYNMAAKMFAKNTGATSDHLLYEYPDIGKTFASLVTMP